MVDFVAELPISKVDRLTKLPNQGYSSTTSEFTSTNGKKYIHKEYKNSRLMYQFPGKSLQEKAASMNRYYEFLRDLFGQTVVPTLFTIAKNEKGVERIMILQEKIEGIQLDKLSRKDPRYKKANSTHRKLSGLAQEINHGLLISLTPRQQEFVKQFRDAPSIINEAFGKQNIIVDDQGEFHIIDW